MKTQNVDIMIVGAGPVGLMCGYLAKICGLNVFIADQSDGPVPKGRADALNARTLQYFEIVNLFEDIYPLGKVCNTSSVWKNGEFLVRRSSWWTELKGCFHKHFLMIGQSHVERLLIKKNEEAGLNVNRKTRIEDLNVFQDGCETTLSSGDIIHSKFVIAADGAHSTIRKKMGIQFNVDKPEIIWAVIDGVISTDFPKVPEIIVFQNETSDVAWIPREGNLDRFYIRMDRHDFSQEEVIEKINRAIQPNRLSFKEIDWFSQFSVSEGVAEHFSAHERVFLAGDACHVHSVNGGMGLNTGLADAFNLIWKLSAVIKSQSDKEILATYENERKTVATNVVASSGELVRSTKYSHTGTHAEDYVKIVERRSGYITGMGVRYGEETLAGERVHDFKINEGATSTRLYSKLDYTNHTLIVFDDFERQIDVPDHVRVLRLSSSRSESKPWVENSPYSHQSILVRPDSFISCAQILN
ncbi:MAG: hypothetical protein RL189_2352 [Pseudomonadota bacterium]|jgi:2-polyprenyl-6-methoxyphenol hydroxylase-like FAD-dependent oxidoreductase